MTTKRLAVEFVSKSWEEYLYWQQQDKKTLKRINRLISDTIRHPFTGIGNPEKLQHELNGYWSRRINEKDRLVYGVYEDKIIIIQMKYHY